MTQSAALIGRVLQQRAAWPARIASAPAGASDNARPAIDQVADRAASALRGRPRKGWCADLDAAAVAILVVEADPALGSALVAQLIADGYRARLACNAERARALAAEQMPKLAIIGDLNSPRGALELLGEVRDTEREGAPWTPDLPIVVVSPCGRELDMLRAFEAGADDFLTHPARYLELRARLRAVLRRSDGSGGCGRPIEVGALAIDTEARAASLDGRSIELRPLEYELLLQLAGAPERVFGKQELLRAVWGYQTNVATRTVDSHACRLRRKLDPDGSGHWVITVWGIGYRLI
jgi:DNA-binding response OmpR family regulator